MLIHSNPRSYEICGAARCGKISARGAENAITPGREGPHASGLRPNQSDRTELPLKVQCASSQEAASTRRQPAEPAHAAEGLPSLAKARSRSMIWQGTEGKVGTTPESERQDREAV